MNNINWKATIRKIDAQMKAVGKERDKIDALLDELTSLRDNCDRAYEALWEARDALSELV
jgi:predicted  nucleic acid-binding Zn-ribbon protein